MSRYVDESEILKSIEELKQSPWYNDNNNARHLTIKEAVDIVAKLCIRGAPTADVEKLKHGHWTHDGSVWKYRFICSECGYKIFTEMQNYCPSCGARMDGGKR